MPDGDANAERMQMALRRFELPLLQFATRITGDRERARDVVQETFVKFQSNDANGYRARFVDLVRKAQAPTRG